MTPDSPQHTAPTTPQRRLWLFRAIALLLPVLFFALLEGGLRLFNYGEHLDLFIPAPDGFSDKEFLMVNPNVAKRYFTKGGYTPQPPYEFMAKQKPPNGYRIIVMGESTTAGWPYPNNVLFSRVLNQRLADAFPEQYIEVVNVAISAINSYTLLDLLDEVLAQQPDAILIYTGHNEFYGALGVASTESLGKFRPFVMLYLSLQRVKTVELLENGIAAARRWAGRVLHGQAAGDPYGTLMGRMIGETHIAYGSPDYDLAKRQFKTNMNEIFAKAKAAGVPIVISEVVSNVRDHAPFVSTSSSTALPADIVYRWAQMLEADGKYELARGAYYWAKDLDALRFRASEDFNEIIHQIAGQYRAPVVPMKTYFEAESPNGLIGHDLMLEHLHPNVEGHFIMSEAFFDTMRRHGMIAPQWDAGRIQPAGFYRERWPISDFDRALGALRIRHLTDHWPFKPLASSGDSFAKYRPSDEIESLAYRVAKEELGFIEGHLAAAKYYEARDQHHKALREYQAMVTASPFDYQVMLTAAQHLLEARHLDRAMSFLFASLNLKDTAFANKWIGQIYLHSRRPQQAEPFLEKANAMQAGDPQVLYNLAGAYMLNGHLDKARETYARLEKTQVDFPGMAQLKQQLDTAR